MQLPVDTLKSLIGGTQLLEKVKSSHKNHTGGFKHDICRKTGSAA